MTNLEGCDAEEGDPDVAMRGVLHSLRIFPQLEACGPAGDPHGVAGELARHVKVEPGRVCGFEGPQVPRNDRSGRDEDSPAHGVEDPMNLPNKTSE